MKMITTQIAQVLAESPTFRDYMANLYVTLVPANYNHIVEGVKDIVKANYGNKIGAIRDIKDVYGYRVEEMSNAFPTLAMDTYEDDLGNKRLSLGYMKTLVESLGR